MALPEPLEPVFVGDNLPAALNEERDAINVLDGAVDERIPFPSGAQHGDLLRWDGITGQWVTTDTRFLEGEGRPEGNVAAPVGSRYIDTTAAAGGVEWVKAVGDLNTGWITMAGDTGLRNVSAMVNKRTTAVVHAAELRRIGNTVSLYLDLTMPNNETNPWDVLTLPVGFRPDTTRYGLMQDNREGAATGTSVTSGGVVNLHLIVKTKRDRFNGTWTTDDPWPATFPGSAL